MENRKNHNITETGGITSEEMEKIARAVKKQAVREQIGKANMKQRQQESEYLWQILAPALLLAFVIFTIIMLSAGG